MKVKKSSAPAPSLMLALIIVGCSGKEPALDTAPEYSEPTYASAGGGSASTDVVFVDVTQSAGIMFEHVTGAFGEKWMPETVGSGAAFFDYDSDGDADLLLVNSDWWEGHSGEGSRPTQMLYSNRGDGTFEDVTAAAGLDISLYGMGVTTADYDADGDQDIYLTAAGPNVLLRNDGGRFVDVTVSAGVSGGPDAASSTWSTGAAWVDVDLDGWLDLFVCNYVQWSPETDLYATIDGSSKSYATPQQYQGESCRLYANGGAGRFTDGTQAAGLLNETGKSLGVVVADFNDDGWPDIVVANDTQRNFLYRNDGDGTFTDIAVRAGVAFDEAGRARAGMGVDVADLTGSGQWSIAIGNFAHEPVGLFTEIGEDLFQDRAGAARLTRSTLIPLTFGVLFADFDLDGVPDLVGANGHIEPGINAVQQDQTFAQRPLLFIGDGTGKFVDASQAVGADFTAPVVGRGLATADIDADGDLDLIVTVNGGSPRLFRNDLPPTSWVGVHLKGAAPNLNGLGATVSVFVGTRVQRRFVRTGSSYLSQSAVVPLQFGLGGASVVDSIVVQWPGTERTRTGPVSAGETVSMEEGR
jgi:hypothetical protein